MESRPSLSPKWETGHLWEARLLETYGSRVAPDISSCLLSLTPPACSGDYMEPEKPGAPLLPPPPNTITLDIRISTYIYLRKHKHLDHRNILPIYDSNLVASSGDQNN